MIFIDFISYSAPQNTFPCQMYLDNQDSDSEMKALRADIPKTL